MNARERRQVYRRAMPLVCGFVAAVSITRLYGTVQEERSLGLPPLLSPADNPMTPEKVALGRKLFFDKRLSADNSISCATCHVPDVGFADPHAVSIGTRGRSGKRNSPSVLNTAYLTPLMWDGKAATLEEQALLPFFAADELDLPPDEAATKLRRQGYSAEFTAVFGEDVSSRTLALALAAYQRSLGAGDSPFDRYLFRDERDAISAEARRGFDVFLSAKCDGCHLVMTRGLHPFALSHVMFTDGKFHNLGVGTDREPQDAGRYDVTADEADWGRFRTPTLRNVALTAPYFHDGSAATLEEVVRFYDEGGKPNRNLDPAMKPLRLTDQQKQDLVAFLHTLTTSAAGSLAQEAGRVRRP